LFRVCFWDEKYFIPYFNPAIGKFDLVLSIIALLYFKNKYKGPGASYSLYMQKNMMGFGTPRFWLTGFGIVGSEGMGHIIGAVGAEVLKKCFR